MGCSSLSSGSNRLIPDYLRFKHLQVRLDQRVTTISGIGSKFGVLLENLNILSVKDLLEHYPAYYNDSSSFATISGLTSLSKKTLFVNLAEVRSVRIRYGKTLQKATFTDATGKIDAVWFNQPYLATSLKQGGDYLLSGSLNLKLKKPQLIAPEYELVSSEDAEAIHLGRIVPVYKLTAGISNKWLRTRIFRLCEQLDLIEDCKEFIPSELLAKYNLTGLKEAYKYIHFPKDAAEIQQGKRRLAFNELLEIQFKLIRNRQLRLKSRAPEIQFSRREQSEFTDSLPFKLTPSQINAVKEISSDLVKRIPMHRLLQGDVGSGKTVVAAIATLQVVRSGYQSVVMAPTSILARQLHANFRKFLPEQISIALVTSKNKTENKSLGKIDVLIGTHALLFQKKKLITNLGLLTVDEQHRFGVNQRRELLYSKDKKFMPHTLHMTATPIPRSIALTLFGDQDVSTLEKPSGRIEPETFLVPEQKRTSSHNWIESKIAQGGQAFWVYPLVEENAESELKSAKAAFRDTKKLFPKLKVGLLHGKLKEEEKQDVLSKFRDRRLDILVSTTVIEVGIDIPGADLMIIESAERFGLAQLHQLRGRIGRNNQESWCLLFTTDEERADSVSRLNFFASETDGLKIAEYDLQKRGPGEVYGTMQSGIPPLKIANFGNLDLLLKSREAANLLLKVNEQ